MVVVGGRVVCSGEAAAEEAEEVEVGEKEGE